MSTSQYSARRHLGRYGGAVALGAIVLSLSAMSVGAQTTPPSSPAAQQCVGGSPILSLANPSAGDVLLTGDYNVSGTAWESGLPSGAGVSRVDVFLGSRDEGGMFLGTAVPGHDATSSMPGSQLAMSSWAITTTVPDIANGGRDFVAYAYTANGQETSVSVPIFVGAPPAATPQTSTSAAVIPPTSTTTSNVCTPAASPIAASGPTMAAPATQPSVAAVVVPAGQPPLLVLSNPSSGDLLNSGTVIIEGVAYDPAATSGSGVDKVDIYLGDRDAGGLFLGSATPGATINPLVAESASRLAQAAFSVRADVPGNMSGGHLLYAYAHSSVTGKDSIVWVPVNVGTPPSPTPRPTT